MYYNFNEILFFFSQHFRSEQKVKGWSEDYMNKIKKIKLYIENNVDFPHLLVYLFLCRRTENYVFN